MNQWCTATKKIHFINNSVAVSKETCSVVDKKKRTVTIFR